jgi:cellulose synthase/poly-beta-1,6-N-acetylglucosamine synthase-like glycosyltransferase
VVAGVGCGSHLIFTLQSWKLALAEAGIEGEAVVVVQAGDPYADRVRDAGATLLEIAAGERMTPGACRNLAAKDAKGEWLCMLDGDVVLDPAFLGRAIAFLEQNPDAGGYGGRIDERHWRGETMVGQIRDLNRIGSGGEVTILAAVWLCRRAAFEQVGGFDSQMPSEEDFDLSLRLRRSGWKIWAGGEFVGFHDCPPRPSLAEIVRRWRSGLFAGQGLALRKAWGTPLFAPLLARQRVFVGALFYLALGLLSLGAALAGKPVPLMVWVLVGTLGWIFMSLRKRSIRLGFLSLLTWTVQGVALLRSWLFGPWGEMSDNERLIGTKR